MTALKRDPVLAVLWGAVAVAVALGVVVAVVALVPIRSSASMAGPGDTHLSDAETTLLAAEPMTPTEAPGFTLTDQHGAPSHLSDFRGKAVVLSFNDDRCTDICTLLAQDVLVADRDLGADRSRVAFLSVNVNPFHPSAKDVRAWTDEHGLGSTPNWTYDTGSPERLSAVERAYQEEVKLDRQHRTIEHGTDLVFIDPSGRERLMGMYGTETANTAAFGHALADAAESTLPAGERHAVAGAVPAASGSAATIVPTALARLGGGDPIALAGDHRATVLTFFSSSCTVCGTELPGIEQEYRKTGDHIAFVGVDVADQAPAARALLARTGVTYPVGVDPTGGVAQRFGVTGLPYTVILDPSGRIVTTHPGLLTADQLAYLLSVLPSQG
jgi:cytochrome oxidase Cu insertion factor (SCO1/SenC/PrrC family)